MSSGKSNRGGKTGSTMQSGSGGIKQEPAEEGEKAAGNDENNTTKPKLQLKTFCDICCKLGHAEDMCPQKPKTNETSGGNTNNTPKCWICKAQGQHTTRNCPDHPKNKKKAEAAAKKFKQPSSIDKLIAENKCLYCGVEGHQIGNCPVKNWGKGPEAESASQVKAGASQVKTEPEEYPQQAPQALLHLKQAMPSATKHTGQQSSSETPQIVPGSVVSLGQDDETAAGKKRRGLKRSRGTLIDGVRMPSYKPAILQAEKEALRALAALEEEPVVLKRERCDSTETTEAVTQTPPSPSLSMAVPSQNVPRGSHTAPTRSPSRIALELTPPSTSTETLPANPNSAPNLKPVPPSSLSETLLERPSPPQKFCATTTAPSTRKRKRRGARRNGGTRLPNGKRMPKYVPAKVQAERAAALAASQKEAEQKECDKKNATGAAQPLLHQVLIHSFLAQIALKYPQPPTPALTPLPGPSEAKSPQIISKHSQSPASGPSRVLQSSSPRPAPTEPKSAQMVPNHPPAPTPAAPHIMQGSNPRSASPQAKCGQSASKHLQPPTPASPRLVHGSMPHPSETKSAQAVPKHFQASAPAPQCIGRGLPPRQAPTGPKKTQISPINPQAPSPARSCIVQGPNPRSAPSQASQIVTKQSQPPVSLPPRPNEVKSPIVAKESQPPTRVNPSTMQGPCPSSAAKEANSYNSAPECIGQSPVPRPAPTKTKSPPIGTKQPQPTTSTPSEQDPRPNPAPLDANSAQNVPTSPQSCAREPLRIALGSTSSLTSSQGEPTDSHTLPKPPSDLSEPLLEPPSPPPIFSTNTSYTIHNIPSKKKKKRRGVKRNRGNLDRETGLRKPHYKPIRLLMAKEAALMTVEEKAQTIAKQEKQMTETEEQSDLETEKTQNAVQKQGRSIPNKAPTVGYTPVGKPIPTRNSAELDELTKKKIEIAKRQQVIKEQKILYTKMLKAQLSMCVPGNQNMPMHQLIPNVPIQYPGFPVPSSMPMVPAPVSRAPVPVTIVNHSNAAVQIPFPPGQNNPGPVRSLAPVNVVEQPAKQPPKPKTPVNMMHHFTTISHYPAGVPRSFLNPEYQEHLNQHQLGQMELKLQEKELIEQQKEIEKIEQKLPVITDTSEHKAESSRFTPVQENSRDSDQPRAYSPSDVYGDVRNEAGSTEPHEGSESPDPQGQKRLSAFKRLGPVTAPKKPKLTINLKCNTDQAVREVVDETEAEVVEEYTPVHLRNDVTTSTDETVMKYLFFWPWKKNVPVRRTASFKNSKSAMMLEQEQMEEVYDKDNVFIQITVTNYPRHWTKEDVFDVLLEQVNVIPCFTEFTSNECKFLVVRSKPALLAIHKMGFKLRKENVELHLSISVTLLTQNQIEFVPRLVLRRRLNVAYDGEGKLDLQQFTLKSDVSHFIYFPLRMQSHQTDVIQLQSVVEWDRLTELNLSHNRLTSIDGFHLSSTTSRLKKLDLSHNYLEKVTVLIRDRNLPLTSIYLEGNPLCHDYTDPAEYVKVVRMMFPAVREIDGIAIHLKGDLPAFNKNFCLYGAETIVEKFLETFYPLLEAQSADRLLIDEMYDENALMTVLYRYKFIHRQFRISSSSSKFVDDGVKDVVQGAGAITKYINKWPGLKHDPFTFTVDVLFHSDTTTIIKICGILKLISETLAEDEPVFSFSRTTLLHTSDGVEYKIQNELLLWDEPTNECHDNAFQVTKIRSKKLYIDLEFDSTPDEESKEKLISIFGHLTELDKNASRRCLEKKDWNLRSALDNFIQLLKLNDLSSIMVADVPRGPPRNSGGRQLVSLTQY